MTKAAKNNLYFIGMILFYIISSFFIIPLIPSSFWNDNMSIIVGQLLIIISTLIYLMVTHFEPVKDIPFKKIPAKSVFLLILFTYLMLPLISLINAISMIFVDNKIAETVTEMSSNSLLFNLFLMALVPAFVEEFVFRGLIFGGYRNSVIKHAMLASALMFGLFHMNVNQFLYAFVMGIIFILVREATGSIYASMIMHFTFNANTVVLTKVQESMSKVLEKYETDNATTQTATSISELPVSQLLITLISVGMFAIIGIALGTLVFKAIARNCHREKHIKTLLPFTGNDEINPGDYDSDEYVERPPEVFGGKIIDIIFILAVILCVLMMIMVEIN